MNRAPSLALALALGLALPAAGARAAAAAAPASAAEGEAAFQAGHYADAARIWTTRANQGDAQAALGLGLMADLGDGERSDPAQAFAWYRRAAATGLAAAEFNAATMLDQGRGVARDRGQAAVLYARAAIDGEPRAAYALGVLYAQGDGVVRNPAVAGAWWHDARAGGVREAGSRLHDLSVPASAAPGLPASPAYPTQDVLAQDGAGFRLPLVWSPADGTPAGYFVELLGLDGGTVRSRLIANARTSALPVRLSSHPGTYAWRVFTVSGRHYATSAWARFAVVARSPLGG